MSVELLRTTVTKIYLDSTSRLVLGAVFGFSAFVFVFLGTAAAVLIPTFYISGLVLAAITLNNRERISSWIEKAKDYLGYKECLPRARECTACGALQCQRHIVETESSTLWLDEELDRAVGGFYAVILNNFIHSWFSALSTDEAFLHLLRQALRDATCRFGVALQALNMPQLITEKLLPVVFAHYEIMGQMQREGVTMDRYSGAFLLHDHPIHPAVCNRKSEIRYLRFVAKNLIPKLIHNQQNYNSTVFYSLLRELLACWVLLPLLDVIADPNLLNALIIVATDPPARRTYKEGKKVAFLDSFVGEKVEIMAGPEATYDFLANQTTLYSFMQFLKREGAVDILRFHLDVDHLNAELQDPRITTDPAKLSSLQHQSEKLLAHYKTMAAKATDLPQTDGLNEAHEAIKDVLYGKWSRAFTKTPEYFQLIYSDKSIPEEADRRKKGSSGGGPLDPSSAGTKLSKLKGAIKVAIDGSTVEAIESPTWDGFNETSVPQNAANILQKAKKERGQSLDQFMALFMQSIEQSTDVGEDVVQSNNLANSGKGGVGKEEHGPPGKSLVFGDHFDLRKAPNGKEALNYHRHPVRGPSKCLVYIASEILRFPSVLIKFMISLVNVSKQTVDSVICTLLQKLIDAGLYEPRLAVLINLLKDQLFGAAENKPAEPTSSELLERQRLAKQRLSAINAQLGPLADMLQSPPMNKHLIYSLFDIIVAEMYPEVLLSGRQHE